MSTRDPGADGVEGPSGPGWDLRLHGRIGSLTLDVEMVLGSAPTALVGPNGAGKTTLLRILSGARIPVSGHVRVGGHPLFDSAAGIDLPPERRRLGYVPQGYALFPHLSALDNVAFGLHGLARSERRIRARAVLAELDAAHLAERAPATLSGGERQRVALARALATAPDALLLDEPLSALDARSRRETRRFLADYLAARARPALVVTHDLRDVVALGGPVVVLLDGRVAQAGTVAELAARPADDFVAEFFQAPVM
ncbi:MAG: ATP-binding cassette domain-containing protein [Gemmatimonadota bacterium]